MKKSFAPVTFIVIFAIAIGNAGSTLYLPALVNISEKLHASSSMMKLTLSSYLISFGISQLFYGPLSESFGRKRCLTTGLFIALVGGIVASTALNINTLIVGRLIEGLGYGAANSVGYAMFRDVFSGKELSKKVSLVSVYLGCSSTLAVVFGSYLVVYLGWRYCFILITFLTLLAILFNILKVPETNSKPKKDAWHPTVAFREYLTLFKSLTFLGSALSTGMGYAGLLSLYSLMPFLIIKTMKFSPDLYGWFTVLMGITFISGAYSAKAFVSKCSKTALVIIGNLCTAIACLVGALLGIYTLNIYVVMIPAIFATFGMGIVIPIGSSCALSPFPNKGGISSALLGTIQFISASIFIGLAGKVHEITQIPMFIYICALSTISFVLILIPHFLMNKSEN